jgi:hypothetical protein
MLGEVEMLEAALGIPLQKYCFGECSRYAQERPAGWEKPISLRAKSGSLEREEAIRELFDDDDDDDDDDDELGTPSSPTEGISVQRNQEGAASATLIIISEAMTPKQIQKLKKPRDTTFFSCTASLRRGPMPFVDLCGDVAALHARWPSLRGKKIVAVPFRKNDDSLAVITVLMLFAKVQGTSYTDATRTMLEYMHKTEVFESEWADQMQYLYERILNEKESDWIKEAWMEEVDATARKIVDGATTVNKEVTRE